MCRRTLIGKRHRYVFPWSDKLVTDSITHYGSDGNRSGEKKYSPVSEYQIHPDDGCGE